MLVCVSLFVCTLGWNALHGSAPNLQYAFAAGAGLIGLAVVFFYPNNDKAMK